MESKPQERTQEPIGDRSDSPSRTPSRRIIAILAAVAVLVIAGTYMVVAQPKDAPQVAASTGIDPAGKWYYLDADSFTLSTIDLDPSGTLLADIYWGDEGRTVTHNGSWSLEGQTVHVLLDNGITEYWDMDADKAGNEILTYRESSAPEKTVAMPGTIAYRSQALMEKNK